jgi:glycosyltransferase involved in cell wall biosynthesis
LAPGACEHLRLVMAGDGPLRSEVQALLGRAGVEHLAWLPGERNDIPAILASLDCFVLPSRAEGISNTILEAMASCVPVIATAVGGNPELVVDGVTGTLVPSGDSEALAQQIVRMAADPAAARRAGEAGRAHALAEFGLDTMVQRYRNLYDKLLSAKVQPAMAADRVGT